MDEIISQIKNCNNIDNVLDLLYDDVDLLCMNKQFEKVDEIGKLLIDGNFSVIILLGYLTITLPYKNLLKNRLDVMKKIHELRDDVITKGLE